MLHGMEQYKSNHLSNIFKSNPDMVFFDLAGVSCPAHGHASCIVPIDAISFTA
jgi:hypothetical protein